MEKFMAAATAPRMETGAISETYGGAAVVYTPKGCEVMIHVSAHEEAGVIVSVYENDLRPTSPVRRFEPKK